MKPRVGISRCLLGAEVRYDGGHKLEPALLEALGAHVEWVEVCPEVEAGMGVPREPVELVVADPPAGVRMIAVRSRRDWTGTMDAWSKGRIRDLASLHLSGYVLKARSPSCGLDDAPVRQAGPDRVTSGRGLFAAALVAAFPDLPLTDEERLRDPDIRRAFLDRVLAYQRSRPGPG